MVTIGVAGNPNAGKSTLFNALTGSHQQVGNWPGKTVEKKEGRLRLGGQEVVLVDLPGTYSLTAYSVEEMIARDFIVESCPDAVVCVVDAANIERNLYLVLQILELGAPMIIALNMSDVAASRGIKIDAARLSSALGGIPVIQTVGNREIGIESLQAAILQACQRPARTDTRLHIPLGEALESELTCIQAVIEKDTTLRRYPARWLALKLLEKDEDLTSKVSHNPELLKTVEEAITRLTETMGDEPDMLIADARYTFIGALVRQVITRPAQERATLSDRLDGVLTHRLLGLPIFLLLSWIVFQVTVYVSAPFVDFVEGVISGPLTRWVMALLGVVSLQGTWVEALLVQGVIAGVGGVIVFLPVLVALYFAIAFLEDSGYMARAAFVMDRLMGRLGLHGKSFLPLLIGFGCNVPAIYSTRTLENARDRKITAFLTTFMSCSARLPVYVMFGVAFFGAAGGSLIFGMYITGIVVAILTSLLFTKVLYRNKPAPPFVMELPPYRVPHLKTVLRSVRERSAAFIQKAGTVIFATSVVIWMLLAIPARADAGAFNEVAPQDSLFGTVSQSIAPVLAPAGFGEWRASGALITGFLAKEAITSTMSQVYVGETLGEETAAPTTFIEDVRGILSSFGEAAVLTVESFVNIVPRTVNIVPGAAMPEANFLGRAGEDETPTALHAALASAFTPLAAVAFCVFTLLYVPCMAAVAAMRHEFGLRWALLQAAYALGVAWLAAVLVFQVGRLLGLGV